MRFEEERADLLLERRPGIDADNVIIRHVERADVERNKHRMGR